MRGKVAPMTGYDFAGVLKTKNLDLHPMGIETLQVNVTKLCNQACQHCHVDASPRRTEQMDLKTINRCLEVLATHPSIKNLDLTGGAPELHPHFDYVVTQARQLGKHVMVRHNLTVTFDGHPQTGEPKTYLPEFFARERVEVISSLPCYQESSTDEQRGKGAYKKSIESLKLLNARGYGHPNSGLFLNLVYNPVGTHLPPDQTQLEKVYKKELLQRYGIVFNRLFTITNMPIARYKSHLIRLGNYETYMHALVNAFNPHAAAGVMCRNLLSVGHDGTLYDCDFNQMIQLKIKGPATIFEFNESEVMQRSIAFAPHCFGCTAGAGSSCGGATNNSLLHLRVVKQTE